MRLRAFVFPWVLAATLGASVWQAQGQGPGGPPHGDNSVQQDDGADGHQGQGPPDRHHGHDGLLSPSGSGDRQSTMHGGLQLGPPGRWWDDGEFAITLHLRSEQQTHMDAVFAQSKGTLLTRYESLREEERQLESLTRGVNIDERTLFAHIDRVSQARAELEKANAHMLLQLRQELTPDQIRTLDEHRPPPR